MREYKVIEVLPLEEIDKIAAIDAPQISTSPTYVADNRLTYYLVCNTWVLLWKNFAKHAWHRLVQRISEQGLISVINEMQDEAMHIVRDEELGPWAKILYAELNYTTPVMDNQLNVSMIGRDDDATVLFLLRYPKRFSPTGNDITQRETMRDFLQYENRTKMLQRTDTYGRQFVLQYVREIIHSMYDWDKICESIDNIDIADLSFSSGSAIDSRATLGSKVCSMLYAPGSTYQREIFGTYIADRPAPIEESDRRVSKVQAVPKSYKSSRIIAMETTFRNAICMEVERFFRSQDECHGQIRLDCQEINQRYAEIGSIDGSLATLDASHASDLISKSLFLDVFPREYTRRVMKWLPTHCEVNGTVRPLQMASTSGHTLTFRHETIVYKAIAAAALEIYRQFGGNITRPVAWAYGDDTIVSSEAFDVAVYCFSRLGLIINEDKSFATGKYRESCGCDYIDGVDVSSVYYPRFPVLGSITPRKVTLSNKTTRDEYRGKLDNSLTMLIDLQKKILPFSYDASRFICSIVQTAYPSITTSVIGSVCTDLWDYVETGKTVSPKAYRRTYKERTYPAIHLKIGGRDMVIPEKREQILPRQIIYVTDGDPCDLMSSSNRAAFQKAARREVRHTGPTVAYRQKANYTARERIAYEYWKYQYFLKYGPKFEDVLGNERIYSVPLMSIAEFFGEKTLLLRTK